MTMPTWPGYEHDLREALGWLTAAHQITTGQLTEAEAATLVDAWKQQDLQSGVIALALICVDMAASARDVTADQVLTVIGAHLAAKEAGQAEAVRRTQAGQGQARQAETTEAEQSRSKAEAEKESPKPEGPEDGHGK